ncbi:hypothetical protein A361_18990 [Cytobacillus oceanisediminis 2691]|uniref:Uncharacterized protein n=1 Tax=Cytobacillus oceanisediminis 2691 TaxID=1196031 RepID=A0A160MDJ0_9BACI|nr:hypothetical protein A361_18990 [Cytobacillus oceanisediminis 2691]
MHKAEDPVIYYLINLLAIRKAQAPCSKNAISLKSCQFWSCGVYTVEAFLNLWASSTRLASRKGVLSLFSKAALHVEATAQGRQA